MKREIFIRLIKRLIVFLAHISDSAPRKKAWIQCIIDIGKGVIIGGFVAVMIEKISILNGVFTSIVGLVLVLYGIMKIDDNDNNQGHN